MEEKVMVLGANWCPDCKRAKKFFVDHRVPFSYVDIELDPAARFLVEEHNNGKTIIPTIIFPDGSILVEPSNSELANKLELKLEGSRDNYDLIVIGGGPAGLSAALYAAREGLQTLVIDRSGLGGQAGVTERIDNYPGFPEGIAGAELADRFVEHARRYGVEMLEAANVTGIESEPDGTIDVLTDGGRNYSASAVVIASGSSYRRLGVEGEDDLIGAGVHFCATCDGPFYKGAKELLVVGGGNSGIEEGLFLTNFAQRVTVLEATSKLAASKLLQDKARSNPKFDIHTDTSIDRLIKTDSGRLGGVSTINSVTGEAKVFHPDGMFIFIGLTPNTSFLPKTIELDSRGFICTKENLETSIPGVFAAGDVRAGSTKQLASAAGEGAAVLLMVRSYLERRGELARHQV